jgi:3-oxoacyl-[acyl-carrier-protein] synthase-3
MSDEMRAPLTCQIPNVRIAGLTCSVPEQVRTNDYFVEKFGDGVEQVTKMTGVLERRISGPSVTTSDLCHHAASHLIEAMGVKRNEIGALIFVSQTPDYRLPATACDLQARLGLSNNVAAFDVNLGCSGYTYGLWLAASLIAAGSVDKILLLVGDTISKIAAEDDRATALLFGDCGTATLLEKSDAGERMSFALGTDGRGARNLIVPEGAFRQTVEKDERNQNSSDKLFMEGSEVFNFTLKAVPALVAELKSVALQPGEDFDFYLFHQANSFMIKHLAKKAKVSIDKAPMNIDRFGNTSSATIPLLLVTACRDSLLSSTGSLIGMFGFGVGYSWAGCASRLQQLGCADLVILK